jgi:hypothetical protein
VSEAWARSVLKGTAKDKQWPACQEGRHQFNGKSFCGRCGEPKPKQVPVGDAAGQWKTIPKTATYYGIKDNPAWTKNEDFNGYDYTSSSGEWLGNVTWGGAGKHDAQVMTVVGERPDGQPLRSSKLKSGFTSVGAAKAWVEAGAKATGTPHLYPKGTKNAHTKDAKRSLLHRAIDRRQRLHAALDAVLDSVQRKPNAWPGEPMDWEFLQNRKADAAAGREFRTGPRMKDIVAESEADYIRRSAGGGFKKAKATDRRQRLHAALDAVMTYSKPPVIRKTLSILNPNDLAKMTGSSEPQYIGKGKPYTGFSKDETPQEKARRKLSPDQAARLKELLAKVKPTPSAAAPMPRAKDSQHWMPVGDRGPYKCDQCNGTGKFPPGKTCPRCGGSGIMNQNDPVILNVGDRVKYDKQPPVYTVTSKSYNTSLNKYYYDIRREDGKQERKGLPIYYLSKV